MKDLKKILNAKVIEIDNKTIYFDNGYCLEVHPYETYLQTYMIPSKSKYE
jgi:hypothetical protein